MAKMTIKLAVSTFIKIREAKAVKERELKDWKANVKPQEDALEKYIRTEMKKLDINSIGADGNTAFEKEKDSVTIEDKPAFKEFLIVEMLTALQPFRYKTLQGEWQPSGEADLAEHVELIAESGSFDLITLTANKTNCKGYMEDSDEGLMPVGIKYVKEISVQIRKGK